ncbi:MAG: branched-chain amino acid ABC transporter permease [bacterium]|nr:branched-chain amino acid ABC transporter permease [bacterium]
MEYVLHILVLIAIYVILGLTLNLLAGYTGLVSLAHAAFFGTGAYVTAILSTRFDLNVLLTMPIGVVVAAVLALGVGVLLQRLRDEYYALATFGINTIFFSIFLGGGRFTKGPLGIAGIAAPHFGGQNLDSPLAFAGLAIVLAALVYVITWWVGGSAFGRTLQAIRDDEVAAEVLGYKTRASKLIVFTISAGLASVAGGLYASYVSYIEPASFDIIESIYIMTIVILGGLARLPGTLVGAVILVVLPELLRFVGLPSEIAGHARILIFGILLVALMLYRPQGLLGRYRL